MKKKLKGGKVINFFTVGLWKGTDGKKKLIRSGNNVFLSKFEIVSKILIKSRVTH